MRLPKLPSQSQNMLFHSLTKAKTFFFLQAMKQNKMSGFMEKKKLVNDIDLSFMSPEVGYEYLMSTTRRHLREEEEKGKKNIKMVINYTL